MEDAVEAIKMAFTMIVFAMALSVSMIAFSTTSAAAESIAYVSDKSNYYSNLQFAEGFDYVTRRVVKADTVIPTLYRYYKENFSVKIYDGTSSPISLIQLFDINTEGKVRTAVGKIATKRTDEEKTLLSKFNDTSSSEYLFEAPWIGDTITHTKTRIDLFVKGEAGFINNVFVDYRNIGFNNFLNDNYAFEEIFVKYTFSGDTISAGDGEDIESITGNKQPEDKVDITYIIREASALLNTY